MGLDYTEIIMAVEEEFGVSFNNDDVDNVRTVGDLHRCIISRLRSDRPTVCRTLYLFLEIRRELTFQLALPPRSVVPSSNLSELMPWHRRRKIWSKLQRTFPALPYLVRPRSNVSLPLTLLIIFAIGLYFEVIARVLSHFGTADSLFLLQLPIFVLCLSSLLFIALAPFVALLAFRPFQWRIDTDWQTVGQLAQKLSGRSYRRIIRKSQTEIDEAEVLTKLRKIVAVKLDLNQEQVQETDRFIEDLRAD